MRRLLRLPESLRRELSEPVGVLVEGSDYLDVARRVVEVVRGGRTWCVGDTVVASLLDTGYVPDVAIIDGRTMRDREIDISRIVEVYRSGGVVYRIENPRGHLNLEIEDIVRSIVSGGRRSLVLVDGEEDMLSLGVIVYAPEGDYVVYGLPGRGVVVIRIDSLIKKRAIEVLRKMLPVSPGGDVQRP